jgi:hypothetical protein
MVFFPASQERRIAAGNVQGVGSADDETVGSPWKFSPI